MDEAAGVAAEEVSGGSAGEADRPPCGSAGAGCDNASLGPALASPAACEDAATLDGTRLQLLLVSLFDLCGPAAPPPAAPLPAIGTEPGASLLCSAVGAAVAAAAEVGSLCWRRPDEGRLDESVTADEDVVGAVAVAVPFGLDAAAAIVDDDAADAAAAAVRALGLTPCAFAGLAALPPAGALAPALAFGFATPAFFAALGFFLGGMAGGQPTGLAGWCLCRDYFALSKCSRLPAPFFRASFYLPYQVSYHRVTSI